MKNIRFSTLLVIALLSTSVCLAFTVETKNQDLDKEFVLDQKDTTNNDLIAWGGGKWGGVDNVRDGKRER